MFDIHTSFIQKICSEKFGDFPVKIVRFTTGLCHSVYSVEYPEKKYVFRIASEEHRNTLKWSLYWIKKIDHLNIPIPKIVVDGTHNEIPFVIFHHIPGKDLWDVYSELSLPQKREIVKGLVSAQKMIETLPAHHGYGYLTSYEDESYKNTWKEAVLKHLGRSRKRMQENGVFDPAMVDVVEWKLEKYNKYFARIKPLPFLEDTSTKNVLIHEWKLSGIVDIDYLCFGDKLYIVALTNMALISTNANTDYIDFWKEELCVTPEQEKILDLYTLIYCLDFMSGIGMQFNKSEPLKSSEEEITKLKEIYFQLAEKVSYQ